MCAVADLRFGQVECVGCGKPIWPGSGPECLGCSLLPGEPLDEDAERVTTADLRPSLLKGGAHPRRSLPDCTAGATCQ